MRRQSHKRVESMSKQLDLSTCYPMSMASTKRQLHCTHLIGNQFHTRSTMKHKIQLLTSYKHYFSLFGFCSKNRGRQKKQCGTHFSCFVNGVHLAASASVNQWRFRSHGFTVAQLKTHWWLKLIHATKKCWSCGCVYFGGQRKIKMGPPKILDP